MLPTGSGKSLCYTALPSVFDILRGKDGHIVIVVSPLVALMKDQVHCRSMSVCERCVSGVRGRTYHDVKNCIPFNMTSAILHNTSTSWEQVRYGEFISQSGASMRKWVWLARLSGGGAATYVYIHNKYIDVQTGSNYLYR